VGRGKESVKVNVEGEDSVGIDPKTLPNRVAALNGGIKYTDLGRIPRPESVADPDLQVGILGVKRLKHLKRI
jgi:hypothetical protein